MPDKTVANVVANALGLKGQFELDCSHECELYSERPAGSNCFDIIRVPLSQDSQPAFSRSIFCEDPNSAPEPKLPSEREVAVVREALKRAGFKLGLFEFQPNAREEKNISALSQEIIKADRSHIEPGDLVKFTYSQNGAEQENMLEKCHTELINGNRTCVCPFTPGDPVSEREANEAAAACISRRDGLSEGVRMNEEAELAGLIGLPKLLGLRFMDSVGLLDPDAILRYIAELKEGNSGEGNAVNADITAQLLVCEKFVDQTLSGTKSGTIDLKLLAIEVESLVKVIRQAVNSGRMTEVLITQFDGIYMRLIGAGSSPLQIRALTSDTKSLISQFQFLAVPPARQIFASTAPVLREVVDEARGLGPYGKIIIVGAGIAAAAVGLYLYFADEE